MIRNKTLKKILWAVLKIYSNSMEKYSHYAIEMYRDYGFVCLSTEKIFMSKICVLNFIGCWQHTMQCKNVLTVKL